MANKIQFRRDTASNWTSVNPTLSQGELGYETDTTKYKIGDGTTVWTGLAYLSGSGDLLAANNLSDLANAATSRTNLGVAIGSDVQAYSSVLANTTASYTTAEETKLSGIETGADVTDAGNVNPLVDTHLNTSTATTGEFLSWDGSDYDWAAAGGGADLYTANPVSATNPTASGTNAIAIGDTAVASGTNSLAIGTETDSTNGSTIALGKGAQATGNIALAVGNSLASGNATMAIGINNNTSSYGASSLYSIAIGNIAKTTGNNNNIAIGNQAAVTAFEYGIGIGEGVIVSATAGIGMGRDSNVGGERAVNINGGQNSTSNYSVSIGWSGSGNQRTQTTGVGALSLMGSNASGQNSFAAMIGSTNNNNSHGAFGLNSIAIGDSARASELNSVSLGASATSEQIGKFAYSAGKFSADGDAQGGQFIPRADTTDATATVLTTNNSTAASTNQVILPNNSAYSFSGTIIARQQAADGSNYASWEIKGALLRDANAASTVLGNGIVNKLFATAGASAWAIALTADTTNGGLKIEATGAAATDIRWVATVNTSEVTYA